MIGAPRPSPEPYSPIEDLDVPPSETADLFALWISAYYQPFRDVQAITPLAMVHRKDLVELDSGSGSGSAKTRYTSTVSRMSPEEVRTVTCPSVLERNPTPRPTPVVLEVYDHNFRRAILDTRGAWPNVDVRLLWTDMSAFYFPWAVKVITQALEKPAAGDEKRRNVRVVKLESANHFVGRFCTCLA